MNKGELIDAISERLGDRRSATEAVNAVLETIQSTVANGDKVAITGFGVFEKSQRAARAGRRSGHPGAGVLGTEIPPGYRVQGPGQRWEQDRRDQGRQDEGRRYQGRRDQGRQEEGQREEGQREEGQREEGQAVTAAAP